MCAQQQHAFRGVNVERHDRNDLAAQAHIIG
jgi:hypothetical protein